MVSESGTHSRLAAFALGFIALICAPSDAVELPVPCVAGSCGNAAAGFVTSGQASAVASGSTLTVDQATSSAVLNWRSFNISRDAVVNFRQPDAASLALNRIFQADASRIFGSLNANGRVYLLNQNGILFGEGARVNVAGLVASSLDITPEAVEDGIAGAVRSVGAPAFRQFRDANGAPLPSGSVRVDPGATIDAPQGQVLLFAPQVVNRGDIRTPDGQTILAAGDSVFLATSADPNLRGLFVEVAGTGTVVNGEDANATRAAASQVGRIAADRGNVTLAGMVVRQAGQISATTSTRANGTVRLLARRVQGDVTEASLRDEEAANVGGTLTVAAGTATRVTLDANESDLTVDANVQPRSQVKLSGQRIEIGAVSEIVATGGRIDVTASGTPNLKTDSISAVPDASRLVVASNARLDVSGARVELPMERNVIRVELRGNQLADSPQQREGPLRSEPVFIDIRESGTRADGTSWQGTPLADVAGDISNIRRSVAERNLPGGDITLQSRGAVILGRDATLDVSGGAIDWQSGYINTTRLLGADSRIYDISDAERDRQYLGILDPRTITDRRWGVTSRIALQGDPRGRFEQGYRQGRDAGGVSILAPRAVLDGDVVGNTTIGVHQRKEFASLVGPVPFDMLPRAARLSLGAQLTGDAPDLVTGDVEFASGLMIPGGVSIGGLLDPLPQGLDVVRIRPALLGAGRVGELTVFSNREVRIASGNPLVFGRDGRLAITAGRVSVASDIIAPSGSIQIESRITDAFRGTSADTSQGLRLAAGVSLLARGDWVNDDIRLATAAERAPLSINGGSVSLATTNGILALEPGSLIDVSAGAQRRGDGTIAAGQGGSIALTVRSPLGDRPADLQLGAELRGYALSRGGSVSIAARSVCIASGNCELEDPDLLVRPQWFASGGFGSISLISNLGELRVEEGTSVLLKQRNYELLPGRIDAPSGTPFADLTRVVELADHVRRPVNLSLAASYRAGTGFFGGGDLYLRPGAALLADPGARVALSADSSAFLDGVVRARGGQISVTLDNTNLRDFIAAQGLWLGSGALLDTSGTSIITPSSEGLLTGSVLAGGSVTLEAQRGFIVTQPGSRIDVSGTIGALDIQSALGRVDRRVVASAGGTVSLSAAEGMLINGDLRAHSGAPGDVASGSLTLRLDTTRRVTPTTRDPTAFPAGDRQVLAATSSSPVIVGAGTALPQQWRGIARLPVSRVSEGGFDFVTLAARNVLVEDPATSQTTLGGYGRIVLEAGSALTPRGRLVLDAASVGVTGFGEAWIASSYVALSRGELADQQINPLLLGAATARPGNGSLSIEANLVDLFGSVSLDGLARAHIRSSGDIRGRGLLVDQESRSYAGRLETAGDLTLRAKQIYPATLADFTFSATGDLVIEGVDGPRDAVLSAGGRLTFEAGSIATAGVLRAPFGQIELRAPRIQVLDGALLSTSAEGRLIPFGTTQGGLAWSYAQSNGITRIFGPDGESLPAQSVVLNAGQSSTEGAITLASGSTIDVSGGGDLLSYEFVPGPGGTLDVLSTGARPDQFAVLPGTQLNFAPFDPTESRGARLQPGDSIWLGAGSGLAEGYYTLLPARYALLPGAYLVTPVTGHQDIGPDESFGNRAGGAIVAGRRGVAGTSLLESRTSGYLVRSGSDARAEARYDLSQANDFFPRVETAESSTRLPRDAGSVTLLASTDLALDGILKAAAAPMGRGSTLELAATSLTVVGANSAPLEGSLAVSAERLSALGAQTLVLGGRLSHGSEGDVLDVRANEVIIADGVRLSAPELVLAGRDLVRVGADAQVTASGGTFSGATELAVSAGASLLRASTAQQVAVSRSASGTGAGVLQIEAGALVSAPGSVTLDVGTSAMTDGRFEIGSGSLALGADRIALGSATPEYAGVVVDPSALGAIGTGSLALRARSALDLFGGTDFSVQELAIATPVIRAAAPEVHARIAADHLTLEGTATVAGAVIPGDGTLHLAIDDLDLAGGTMALSGFAASSFASNGTVIASNNGRLLTPGDLALSAGLITARAGTDFAFEAARGLRLGVSGSAAPMAPDELGGKLSFSAATISGAARVRAAAGEVEFLATGNVALAAETALDVGGRTIRFDDVDMFAPGGLIRIASQSGAVTVGSNAVLDVSSASAGSAGRIDLFAPEGVATVGATLHGAGEGSMTVVAQDFGFDALRLALAAGGFTGDWNLRRRGTGDITLAAGESIVARSVSLTADDGAIRIDGAIDAHAPRGGRISLAAADALTVAGTLNARATDENVRGGRVDLFSGGGVLLGVNSVIDVGGTTLVDPQLPVGGRVMIRAPRQAFPTAVRIDGDFIGARSVIVEGVETYSIAGGVISTADVSTGSGNPWFSEARAFGANAGALAQAIGVANDSRISVRAGVELVAEGDLFLTADWNLYDWRFGPGSTLPGVLTMRATGNVSFDQSLNDGFSAPEVHVLPGRLGESWSYRIAAGADLASANPLATARSPDASAASGSVIVGPGIPGFGSFQRVVRTGTGDIDIAAAADLVLTNPASVIYTAGLAGPGIRIPEDPIAGGLNALAYPFNGGDVAIDVGRDALGARSAQLYSEWLLRSGGPAAPLPTTTAWTVAFDRFEQGLAILGGGRLEVTAARDVRDLSASVPTIGRQTGGLDPGTSRLEVSGGGDLKVRAGRSVIGGQFYVDGGEGAVIAGDSVVAPIDSQVAPVLALGAASLSVQARRDLAVATALNPTLIAPVDLQFIGFAETYFGTYAPQSAVSLVSSGGDVDFVVDVEVGEPIANQYPNYPFNAGETALTPISVLPPAVTAASLSESVRIGGPFSLWPAPRGDLRLFAREDVHLAAILMSDAALGLVLPTPERPSSSPSDYVRFLRSVSGETQFNAPAPVHVGDPEPARIVALAGDVLGSTVSAPLYVPKALRVVAGRDIVGLTTRIQHFDAGNVSTISAGRDVTFVSARGPRGALAPNLGQIEVDGPGRLEILSGRNFDLQTSRGLISQGNLRNRALPAGGADISVTAGLGDREPAYEAFIEEYLASGSLYDAALTQYVERMLSRDELSKSAALALFRLFNRQTQRGLLEAVLFAELRAGGRSAAQPGPTNGDFTRAFAALEAMFPGSNPDLDGNAANPYAGDIRLFFSRLYTLAGGDIRLIAPGGEINVGLATPPLAFGVRKEPSELGIVVQSTGSVSALSFRDFQVNESRTFAADGGNILVWSTRGDIDAGRGAKTAISAPPPDISIDDSGNVVVRFLAALSGSGIQTLSTTVGRQPGDVDLFAPRGVVNAGDAGIVAGNLTIAATAVLGANNIQVSGTAVGVPVDTAGLGAGLAGVSSVASGATNEATDVVAENAERSQRDAAPLADTALGWLEVFIEGFGEDVCKPNDMECLRRQQTP